MIRGEKWITLNNGDEYIRLTGVIRSKDIGSNNTIVSNKVANARIQYSGTGDFADTQEQGWLTSFFSSQWWPL
jgi:flagellar L-ring protein precursor FlgH